MSSRLPAHLSRRQVESDCYQVFNEVIDGFQDIRAGRYYEITGDWTQDKDKIMDGAADNL